jgi:hypothetical protein
MYLDMNGFARSDNVLCFNSRSDVDILRDGDASALKSTTEASESSLENLNVLFQFVTLFDENLDATCCDHHRRVWFAPKYQMNGLQMSVHVKSKVSRRHL